jgi:hypothetical protein
MNFEINFFILNKPSIFLPPVMRGVTRVVESKPNANIGITKKIK